MRIEFSVCTIFAEEGGRAPCDVLPDTPLKLDPRTVKKVWVRLGDMFDLWPQWQMAAHAEWKTVADAIGAVEAAVAKRRAAA